MTFYTTTARDARRVNPPSIPALAAVPTSRDDDRNAWVTDPNGTPQDPWQVCNTLPFNEPETGQEFVFSTGSCGGIGAGGKLSTAYGRQRHKLADKPPVIEIGLDSYRHKTYGDVSYPTFRIVGWQSEADLIAGETNGVDLDEELDDVVPFQEVAMLAGTLFEPEVERMARVIQLGVAYFAESGPVGATCPNCSHLDLRDRTGGRWKAHCLKFTEMTSRCGPKVPKHSPACKYLVAK